MKEIRPKGQKLSILLSIVLLFAVCGTTSSCSSGISADAVYYSDLEIGLGQAAGLSNTVIISCVPLTDQLAVLIRGYSDTVVYKILYFDGNGNQLSSVDITGLLPETSDILTMASESNGNLSFLVSDVDDTNAANVYSLFSSDSLGEIVDEKKEIIFEKTVNPTKMVVNSKGDFFILSEGAVSLFDSQGKAVCQIMNGSINGSNILLSDDQVYVTGFKNTSDTNSSQLYELDCDRKSLGEVIDVADYGMTGNVAFSANQNGIYGVDSVGIFLIDLKNQEGKPLLFWKNTDVSSKITLFGMPVIMNNENVYFSTVRYTSGSKEQIMLELNREETNPNIGKKIIVLGGMGLSYDQEILAAVYIFNQNSADCRIEIKDYAQSYSGTIETDYNTLINTMNTEILLGIGPDIIYGGYESLEKYAQQDLLTDLNTFVANDADFKIEDYNQSILRLCGTDEHLYQICPGYFVDGLVGAVSQIGASSGWTTEEFANFTGSVSADTSNTLNASKSTILYMSLRSNMDTFVDSETQKVNFQSDAFKDLLEFAMTNGLPDELANTSSQEAMELIKTGDQKLILSTIFNPRSFNYYALEFGEPICVKGFPGQNRSGPVSTPIAMTGISSTSENQQDAWEFIKILLGEEVQKKISESGYAIPVLQSAFEAQIASAMFPEENTSIDTGVQYGMYDESPMSEENAQSYRDFISSLENLGYFDSTLYDVIFEESQSFFNGDKTSTQVAELIQNRVQIIIDERK